MFFDMGGKCDSLVLAALSTMSLGYLESKEPMILDLLKQ
jgi:hypothetical protein